MHSRPVLDVSDDRGRAGAPIEAIPGRARGMIEGHGPNAAPPDAKRLAGMKAMEDEAGWHLLKPERKQWRREQGQQHRSGGCATEIATPDMDFAALVLDRPEEEQPRDMVIMQMCQQQVDRLIVRPVRPAPKIDDPRSSVDDVSALGQAYLDAGWVAAIQEHVRTWYRTRAAHAPERQFQSAGRAGSGHVGSSVHASDFSADRQVRRWLSTLIEASG